MIYESIKDIPKEKCEICGVLEKLCVHHINGEHDDNSSNNIMVLCKSCHSLWHWQNGFPNGPLNNKRREPNNKILKKMMAHPEINWTAEKISWLFPDC